MDAAQYQARWQSPDSGSSGDTHNMARTYSIQELLKLRKTLPVAVNDRDIMDSIFGSGNESKPRCASTN